MITILSWNIEHFRTAKLNDADSLQKEILGKKKLQGDNYIEKYATILDIKSEFDDFDSLSREDKARVIAEALTYERSEIFVSIVQQADVGFLYENKGSSDVLKRAIETLIGDQYNIGYVNLSFNQKEYSETIFYFWRKGGSVVVQPNPSKTDTVINLVSSKTNRNPFVFDLYISNYPLAISIAAWHADGPSNNYLDTVTLEAMPVDIVIGDLNRAPKMGYSAFLGKNEYLPQETIDDYRTSMTEIINEAKNDYKKEKAEKNNLFSPQMTNANYLKNGETYFQFQSSFKKKANNIFEKKSKEWRNNIIHEKRFGEKRPVESFAVEENFRVGKLMRSLDKMYPLGTQHPTTLSGDLDGSLAKRNDPLDHAYVRGTMVNLLPKLTANKDMFIAVGQTDMTITQGAMRMTDHLPIFLTLEAG